MLLFPFLVVVAVGAITKTRAVKVEGQTTQRTVTKYGDNACGSATSSQVWTIVTPSENDLVECTTVSSPASESDTPRAEHEIPDLTLLARSVTYQELHLICNLDGSYSLGVYQDDGGSNATCRAEFVQEMYHFSGLDQSENLVHANCAVADSGSSSFLIQWDGLSQPANCTSIPSATGDPHLTNLHGDKFDIHDGLHRFVHYPRNAPEQEALLKVDAYAVDMGQMSDCYAVYLQTIKLSGKWIGDEITVSANSNPSMDSSSPSNFGISFAHEQIDWPTLSKRHGAHLSLKGSRPIYLDSGNRSATSDAPGGEELTFKVGDAHPVILEVWSSHGQNWLTHGKQVRYLNLEVKNLPKESGGIIGLDKYIKPSTSRCGLVQQERDLMAYIDKENPTSSRPTPPSESPPRGDGKDNNLIAYIDKEMLDMSLVQVRGGKFPWTAKVSVQQ